MLTVQLLQCTAIVAWTNLAAGLAGRPILKQLSWSNGLQWRLRVKATLSMKVYCIKENSNLMSILENKV